MQERKEDTTVRKKGSQWLVANYATWIDSPPDEEAGVSRASVRLLAVVTSPEKGRRKEVK